MWAELQNAADPVLPAVQMDAACVVVNLFMLPDEPDLFRQCVQNIARVREDCTRYGMPLMIEPLVMLPNVCARRLSGRWRCEKIVTLVRLATDMGADIIKADPTSDPLVFHRVVEAARVPVLARGGGKEDLKLVLEKSAALVAQGARGLVYGRNIYQHANPKAVWRPSWRSSIRGQTAQPPGRSTIVEPDLLLGIDIGNTIVKAVLFDLAGRQVARHGGRRHHPQARARNGRTARSRALVERTSGDHRMSCRIDTDRIAAIGLAGHGNGLYLLDQAGKALLGIQSLDSRAAALAAELDRSAGSRLKAICGQRPWPSQTPTLLAWIKANQPEVYARAGTLCFAKDIIGFCLTGQRASDGLGHVGSGPSAPAGCTIRCRLLSLYGLSEALPLLPRLCLPTDIVGHVTSPAAAATGCAKEHPSSPASSTSWRRLLDPELLERGRRQSCLAAGPLTRSSQTPPRAIQRSSWSRHRPGPIC